MNEFTAVKKIELEIPVAAYKLLQKGAKEAKLSKKEFARVCIYSVLANYAEEVKERDKEPDRARDAAVPVGEPSNAPGD